jgi:elongation factor Ts
MENTSELIKVLRERTGAGIMECKKALIEAKNDLEKAIDLLRQKGIAKAAKKAERETSEGRIGTATSSDRKRVSFVKLSCETDFVAKNELFADLVNNIAKAVLDANTDDVNKILALPYPGGKGSIDEQIKELIGKIGENMQLQEATIVDAKKGIVDVYTHLGNKLVVMVEIHSDKQDVEELTKLAHELAMQIAIDNPDYVCREEVPSDVVGREREVIKASPDLASKPDAVKEKIVDGKLGAFFGTCCLLELPYMRDGSIKIKDIVSETSKKLGAKVDVICFKRASIGK